MRPRRPCRADRRCGSPTASCPAAVDAKGSLAALICAAARFARSDLPARVVVVGAVDEERHSAGGTQRLVRRGRRLRGQPALQHGRQRARGAHQLTTRRLRRRRIPARAAHRRATDFEHVPAVRSVRTDPVVRALSAAIRENGARPVPKLKLGTADRNVVGPQESLTDDASAHLPGRRAGGRHGCLPGSAE
ncbi:M20/M25/M40 family metallo-hydrolase [Streptomyces sp. NPDC088253]|uniref:M20/M25/M40 family metallo-hydrolase n=1 Tax=Streptomyces sp. NPDC088253 TaxID=3365846 RepID=UPI00380CA427